MEISFLIGNSIEDIVTSVKKTKIGFAGIARKEWLKKNLENKNTDPNLSSKLIRRKKGIETILIQTNNKVQKVLSLDEIYVFIIPTSDKFVTQNMNGVLGYSPYKNTIHLYVNPDIHFRDELEKTFIHEYNHAYFHTKRNWKSLLDSLIAEGLAEVFSDEITKYKQRSKWTNVLTDIERVDYWLKLKNQLDNENLHSSVFFARNDEFPIWTGYDIGYNIVNLFRQKYLNLSWEELMNKTPDDILILSEFDNKYSK